MNWIDCMNISLTDTAKEAKKSTFNANEMVKMPKVEIPPGIKPTRSLLFKSLCCARLPTRNHQTKVRMGFQATRYICQASALGVMVEAQRPHHRH
jgi:hypothetical protein